MSSRTKKPGIFKRLNYFKGLFLQAEDWKREQEYHMIKQQFHNKYLHKPGVVRGCLGEMQVSASKEGTAFSIAPGLAIDGEGRDIYLPNPLEIDIPALQSFNPPTTVYLFLSYNEKGADRRSDDANPAYTGFAFVEEIPKISMATAKPDNIINIELARVELAENTSIVKDPGIMGPPGPGEIDMSFVPHAGTPLPEKEGPLTLDDIGLRVMDTSLQVGGSGRKKESTVVLIESLPETEMIQPIYMIYIQSLDRARLQWWTECEKNGENMDYSLHILNDSSETTTVVCRVYRMRTA